MAKPAPPPSRPRRVLKLRVATGLGLAAALLVLILWTPAEALAIVLLLCAAVGLTEWAALCGFEGRMAKARYVVTCLAVAVATWLYPTSQFVALALSCAFWVCAAAFVVTYPLSRRFARRPATLAAAGGIIFVGAWHGLMTLRELDALAQPHLGPWLVVWALVVASVTDTGAYFAGRAFGRRRLAPNVSPAKTWEGFAGGVFTGVLTGTLLAWWLDWGPLGQWLALAFGLALIAVVGDLFESAVKRARGVKDSGALLPGHGGVLDRIDSALAAAPAFALWAVLFLV